MDMIIVEMTSTAAIAIAVFGIILSLLQTKYSRVSRSFALFLAAVAINSIPDAAGRVLDAMDNQYVLIAELIIWTPSTLCVAPLFWVYLFALTSTAQRRPKHLYRHFLLPGAAILVGLIVAFSPQDVSTAIFLGGAIPTSGWFLALVALVVLFQVALYPQMAIYLFLIVRRMISYRLTLRDYYASTEKHELRWVYIIGGLGWLYWVMRTLILFVAFDTAQAGTVPAFIGVAGFSSLALIAAMTLWGLRQRPPLVPDVVAEPTQSAEEPSSDLRSGKYEKSALSADASARIARKLRAAMERDHLHRDPNLSLWALAQHVGASPNYISQTLSEEIGESFFDFVNGYRIAEAKTLLATTGDTVLTITYEVGFNARSSFYNAFKRVTGETPTSYRKAMSQPAGLDDMGT